MSKLVIEPVTLDFQSNALTIEQRRAKIVFFKFFLHKTYQFGDFAQGRNRKNYKSIVSLKLYLFMISQLCGVKDKD